ncbi:type II toxin-antitoxin system YoeB family toxin [Sphingomonas sp. NPDC079357]|uniref:type II toxin-antitoxin system YoeB family toxin n=1 Tax=Sphingomonas sp. NPDC079357 TaxID=3364518 RepID=UPI00384CC4BE
MFAKVNALVEECRRHPFKGTGKPEPLGGNLSGWGRAGSARSIAWCSGWREAAGSRCCR